MNLASSLIRKEVRLWQRRKVKGSGPVLYRFAGHRRLNEMPRVLVGAERKQSIAVCRAFKEWHLFHQNYGIGYWLIRSFKSLSKQLKSQPA